MIQQNITIFLRIDYTVLGNQTIMHQNHPTLYPFPAKWGHINSPLQLCCLQAA